MLNTLIMTSYLLTPDASVFHSQSSSEWLPTGESLAMVTQYELDPFQKHAVTGIHAGNNIFVTAPTGSGKTMVGEYLIAFHLRKGGRIFYTTPIKSLSNQKYHDLKLLFPDNTVGIMTGDIKMCPHAQIIVMTAEILRNLLFKRGTVTETIGLTSALSLEGVSAIIMDEVHYIQDPDRGHVWEESLILSSKLPFQLVLLSATMPSAKSLAQWLVDLYQKPIMLLSTQQRSVPLVHAVLGDMMTISPMLDTHGHWTDAYSTWLKARKDHEHDAEQHKKNVLARKCGGYTTPVPGNKIRVESATSRLLRTISWLSTSENLPALFFVFSRKECESYAHLVPNTLLDSSDTATVKHIITFHLSRYKLETSPQYHLLIALLERGIAFHHSGLQPLLKEIVEILFSRGFVKVLFATETFAVGLNMPTKTVMFLGMEKWSSDEGCRRFLRPDEYIQMAGRAGRRGKDTRGLVLYEPMRRPLDGFELKSILTTRLPDLQSRMRFHYDFILKNVLGTNGHYQLVEQSYWAQEQLSFRKSLGQNIIACEEKIASAKQCVSDDDEHLLSEYIVLQNAIRTSVNASQKKAKIAMSQWINAHDFKNFTERLKRYEVLQAHRESHIALLCEATTWDSTPILNVDPLMVCLNDWEFIVKSTSPPVTTLTQIGIMGTEINEGHPILMPLLADSECMQTLSGAEIAIVLSTFIHDDSRDTITESYHNSSKVIDVLRWIEGRRQECISNETDANVHSPQMFWQLSSVWPHIIEYWLNGVTLAELANMFEMFEGNIQRGIMRLSNILEEWTAISTIRSDLTTLEKLSTLNLLRGEIVADSLYLRMKT